MERIDLLRAVELAFLDRQLEGEQVVGPETEVDVGQLDQAVDRKSAAGEQRQRQREFAGNERTAQRGGGCARPTNARLLSGSR